MAKKRFLDGRFTPPSGCCGIDVCRVHSACLNLVLPEFSREVSKKKMRKRNFHWGFLSAKASIVDNHSLVGAEQRTGSVNAP
jgi:hypothetical protein